MDNQDLTKRVVDIDVRLKRIEIWIDFIKRLSAMTPEEAKAASEKMQADIRKLFADHKRNAN